MHSGFLISITQILAIIIKISAFLLISINQLLSSVSNLNHLNFSIFNYSVLFSPLFVNFHFNIKRIMSFKVLSNELHSSRILKGKISSEISYLQSNLKDYEISFSSSPTGVVVHIQYQSLSFQVTLSKSYPSTPPTLSCNTVLSFPSLSDGRDLLPHILLSQWSPSTSLYELLTSLPRFLQSHSLCEDIGQFHLSMPIHLSTWRDKPDMTYFFCMEIDLTNPDYLQERIIVVTHTYLIILQVYPILVDVGCIVAYGRLRDIKSIRVEGADREIVALEWNGRDNKHMVFRVREANEMIEIVKINFNLLRALGNIENILQENQRLKRMRIYEMLRQVEEFETQLHKEYDPELLKRVVNVIQDVVEYYSAAEDKRYVKYLNKVHELFSKFVRT